MADFVDKATRSRYMAAIKSRGNQSTEIKMARLLRESGLKGWRRHSPLPGTPDFCWPKYRIALFVDGCFWHGCPRCYKTPKSNVSFWQKKIESNRGRDRRVGGKLRRMGWTVIRVWECRIKFESTITRIELSMLKRGWNG